MKSVRCGASGRIPVRNGRRHSDAAKAGFGMPCGGIRSPRKKDDPLSGAGPAKVAAYQAGDQGYPAGKNRLCGRKRYRYIPVSGIWVCAEGPTGVWTSSWPEVPALRHCRCSNGRQNSCALQYNGTMDSRLFEFWFSSQLLPSLEPGTVIVMDNASFHSKNRLFSAAQNAGCRVLFLPPYSPELNPIELFWAWLKRFLRKILPSAPSFDDALCTAFHLW